MSDRYRKVRRALRAIHLYVLASEKLPNRAARRHSLYGKEMLALVEKLKVAKRSINT